MTIRFGGRIYVFIIIYKDKMTYSTCAKVGIWLGNLSSSSFPSVLWKIIQLLKLILWGKKADDIRTAQNKMLSENC